MFEHSTASPVVVVPVHRPQPTDAEKISLRQCGRCLTSRPIFLLAPEGLPLDAYRQLLPITGEIRVEPRWMESKAAYNRLMISPVVYRAIGTYSHLLVHEPDAIVLKDELDYWCSRPYDYIGAAWFEVRADDVPNALPIGVGNFGFSLTRVDAINQVLQSWRRWYPLTQIGRDLMRGLMGRPKRLLRALQAAGNGGRLRGASKLYDQNCDIFWSQVVPRILPTFRVAPTEMALRFAWEVLPRRCHEICGGSLPFGIHAWARYDPPFLEPVLEASGVELDGFPRAAGAKIK